jgi:mono/diheme cytochrome c family protein
MRVNDLVEISTMKLNALGAMLVGVAISGCVSQRAEQRPLAQLSGVELYEQLCASCHGVDAKGDGPVAPLIKTGVSDLTRLAHRDGGEFPEQDVLRTIDGRWDRRAHGARDMPVWGWQLYSSNDASERARVDAMLGRLVEYLRSVQTN